MKQRTEKTCSCAAVSEKKDNSSARGFALIETVIALVIMTIVGLGSAALFAYAANNNTGARDRVLSMAVAQQQMERLRNASFANLSATVASTGGADKTVTSAGRQYQVVTTISGSTTLKTVEVKVTPLGAGPAWSRTNSIAGGVVLLTQRTTYKLGSNR